MEKEKMAFFAFSFVILAVGGPCGFVEKYFTFAKHECAHLEQIEGLLQENRQ